MNVERNISILKLIAEDVVPVSNAKLAAMIFYRGKMVSIGTNQYKTHPFAKKYGKNDCCDTLHAEVDAINKAKKKLTEAELKKATLLIVRVKKEDRKNYNFGLAKPCPGCSKCIEDHKIRTVVYTDESSYSSMKFVTEIHS